MENKIIGENIREMRLYRGFDKDTFAKDCDVDVPTVTKWEKNIIAPTSQELYVIAKVLRVDMEFFFEELKNDDDYIFISLDNSRMSAAMCLMTEIQISNVARKILLWRMIREELLHYVLRKYDNPRFLVKNTNKKQREDLVASFAQLFGNEYDEVIAGYVAGKNEISILENEILRRSEEHYQKEKEEKKRCDTETWKIYKTCINYLDKALNNELVDLRYAALAEEKLGAYLAEHNEGINDAVLKMLHDELKTACANDDEEGVRKVLAYLWKYGEALWERL